MRCEAIDLNAWLVCFITLSPVVARIGSITGSARIVSLAMSENGCPRTYLGHRVSCSHREILGHIVFSGRNLIFCCSNSRKRGGVQGLPGFGLECSFIDSRYRAGRFGCSAGSDVTTKYQLWPPYRANRWQYTGSRFMDRSLSRLVCGLPRHTAAAR